MSVRLTVIVPVFNVARYLEPCLSSVGKNRGDVEIICVDDGSTDGSGEMLDSMVERFGIRVIHQANAGVSVARNRGLEVATGEWITFCDPDDAYVEGAICWLLKFLAICKADMVVYGFAYVNDVRQEVQLVEPCVKAYDMRLRQEALKALKSVYPVACNACYRREFVGGGRFASGVHSGEDSLFGLERMLKADNVMVLDAPLYKYVQRDGSCLHTISERRVRGLIDASRLTWNAGRGWRWYRVGKNVFFRKARLASIGESAGLIPSFGPMKRRELWDYFFDRLHPVFGDARGYVPWHLCWLYRLAFRLRSPFFVYWFLHKPYAFARSLVRMKLLLAIWQRIR